MAASRHWTFWLSAILVICVTGLGAGGIALGLGYVQLEDASLRPFAIGGGVSLCCLAIYLGWLLTTLGARSQRLRQAISQQSLPQAVVDENNHISYANEAFAALVGLPVGRLQGVSIHDYIEPEYWQQVNCNNIDLSAASQGYLVDGNRLDSPIPFTDTNQRRHWVLLCGSANPALPHGSLLVSCWEQNTTYNKLTQQRRKAKAYQSVLQHSQDVLLWLDSRGDIVGANERSRLLLGKAIASLSFSVLLHEDDIARVKVALKECAGSKDSVTLRRLKLRSTHRDQVIHLDAKLQCSSLDGVAFALTGSSVNHFVAAEAKLRSSEERLAQAFENSPNSISIIRRSDGEILSVNEGFTELLGYSKADAIGKPIKSLALWKNSEVYNAFLEDLANSNEDVAVQSELTRTDGTTFVAEISQRVVEIDNEECLLVITRDVSERVEAETSRAASEEKFLRTFENSPDGIVILRKEGAIISDINPALVAISGYDREHFIGRSLFEVDVMANLAEMEPSDAMLKENQQFENVEMTFRIKDGTNVPAIVSAKQFEMLGEQHLLAIVRDVRELRKAQVSVARSEERFRGAFENAQLAMILVDLEGMIFHTNRFAQDLLSYTQSEMDGMHISRLIPQEEKINLKESLLRLTQGSESRHRSERRMLSHNGLEIWTNFQIVLQQDPDQGESYFFIQAADVTDIKLSQRRMERMAFYDTLTDLANRRLFQDRLQHAIEHCQRNSRMSALLYLDLDQFKRVNDTLGHEAGDALLREVALRLSECVRTEDTVGRTGGDEFTVLLFDVENTGDAGLVAEKILVSLREPILISGHNLVVTTSIGIAIIPNDGRDANVVMKNADLAMYRAKERGRNNFQFFSEDMNTKAILRLRTENELREGLGRGEFVLHHQPKYRISDGMIIGAEALVRWNHPTRGLLPPGEFIQIAEETGAIVNLGSWVMEESCKAGKHFADIAEDHFVIAVNISPRQFRDPNLISHIRRCLRTSGLPANMLQIEITETMLMHDVEAASIIVERLNELGTSIAIDDFGTGYSSLNYLKKFPIQTVKVDRSFVTDIPHNSDDMAITAAVIAMAHRLNMDVVAEGVETAGQLQFLAENRCEFAQGYLFSKPVTPEVIEGLIRRKFSEHCRLVETDQKAGANPPLENQPLPRPPAGRLANSGREK